ncbi:MAG TPA: hypothetical protein PLC90_13860 [Bacteroidales bacterium]|nr:hypothetical protein [Paludibacteraceae bacterium]HPB25619.1 hypothetical protein [Bacteroidales bacterium]HQN17424.1 hypothetical protein [Bacteroidales bacterium]
MLQNIIQLLERKPASGVITWFTGWTLGNIQLTNCYHRELILWYFQIISLGIGTLAGILTIIALIIKIKKNRHE